MEKKEYVAPNQVMFYFCTACARFKGYHFGRHYAYGTICYGTIETLRYNLDEETQ